MTAYKRDVHLIHNGDISFSIALLKTKKRDQV